MNIHLEQGSDAWHSWRREGLGSSDAPVVMGVSPWKSRVTLWREKTTGSRDDRHTMAMQRGIDLEPAARLFASQQLGADFQPTCFQHESRPWWRASLDGYCAETQLAIEIKCPGEQDHASAMRGQIPNKYQWQLVHQLICTGQREMYYVSYSPQPDARDSGVILKFVASQEQTEMLTRELDAFWKCCNELSIPEEGVRDGVQIEDESWLQLAREYTEVEKEMSSLEQRKRRLRASLCEPLGDHRRIIGGGLVITRHQRQGNIDYGKIPSLENLDLEPYRKEGTFATHIRIAGI